MYSERREGCYWKTGGNLWMSPTLSDHHCQFLRLQSMLSFRLICVLVTEGPGCGCCNNKPLFVPSPHSTDMDH